MLQVYDKVADVIEEPGPDVVATVNMTRDVYGQMVRPGTILFPSRSKKTLKKKKSIKKGEVANAEFTTTMNTKIHLPMDCAAGFSTQVKDVKLFLPELMAHLTLPVEVKCFAHQKSRHCNSMRNITLTKVCEEAAITGGLSVEGDTICDEQFDLPLDLPVQVACVDLTKEDLQQSLYARVRSTYESVDRRLAANKKVAINGDAGDKAQQEFYSTVRTDIAQDVVTVDVPERIYDEVGFGSVQTGNTYKDLHFSNSAETANHAPPLPAHDSKDGPYVQLLSKVDSETKEVTVLPKPLAPLLPPKPDFDSANGHTKPRSAATYINEEATSPQTSTAASPFRTQVPTPPPLLPLQKAAMTNHRESPIPLSTVVSHAHMQIQIPTSPPIPPPRRSSIDTYDVPTLPLNSTAVLHVDRDAASNMPDLGKPTEALNIPPPLPAQDKKQKKRPPPPLHSKPPPPLHSKPPQPVLRSPPQTLPRKQEAIYEEIPPDGMTASVYTPMVHDKPTRLPPAPAPKPASFKRAHTQPQLQVQTEGSNPIQVDEAGNIEYLKTLSCNDIIRLLEAMGLHQYIDSFMKVSGIQ